MIYRYTQEELDKDVLNSLRISLDLVSHGILNHTFNMNILQTGCKNCITNAIHYENDLGIYRCVDNYTLSVIRYCA